MPDSSNTFKLPTMLLTMERWCAGSTARGSVPAMRICSYRNWQLMSDISGLTAMSANDTLYPRSRRSRAVFRGTSDVRNVPSIMRLYPIMESASIIASTIRPAHAAVCAGESMPYWAQICLYRG